MRTFHSIIILIQCLIQIKSESLNNDNNHTNNKLTEVKIENKSVQFLINKNVRENSSFDLDEINMFKYPITLFLLTANIYDKATNDPIKWNEEYSNFSSPEYTNLTDLFCETISSYLTENADHMLNYVVCADTVFTKVNIGTNSNGVSGKVILQFNTTTATQLSAQQLKSSFLIGYNQSTTNSSIQLTNVQITRLTPPTKCTNVGNVCGPHASCKNSLYGIRCICYPIWFDVNPKDSGQNCIIHPAIIVVIIIIGILLLSIILFLICCCCCCCLYVSDKENTTTQLHPITQTYFHTTSDFD